MKKLKLIASVGLVVGLLASLLALTACMGKIKVPANLKIDWDHNLTWNEVPDARIYNIEIKKTGEEEVITKQTRKLTYSLASLEEGQYEIRVRALFGDNDDSEWSEAITFNRPYETGCIYELVNNSEYHIVKAGKASGVIYVEAEYRNRPVTAIAESAFKNNSRVTGVVIGENVKSIGEKAFYNCRNLVSITNLGSVESIGVSAFQGCSSLTGVEIPESIGYISDYAFAYCRSLTSLNLGNRITSIGASAFSDCITLEAVTIPDTVITIGREAFMGNEALKSVSIGKGVQEIGSYAFYLCKSLVDLEFAEDSQLNTIGSYAFSRSSSLAEVTLPVNLEVIGGYAFEQCSALANIDIPESVVKIGYNAFYATKLYIDQYEAMQPLFYADNWLIDCHTYVKVGAQHEDGRAVEFIGVASAEDISEIRPADTDKVIQQSIVMRSDVVGIADDAMFSCHHLKVVILPESVKYVGDGAFEYCKALWKFQSKGAKNIGVMAFYQTILSNLILNEGVERIEDYAFYATNLSSIGSTPVKIPSTVKSIGTDAFRESPLWNTKDSYGIIYADTWVVGQQLIPSVNAEGAAYCDVILKENTIGIADYAFYSDLATGNIYGMFLTSIGGLEDVMYIGRSAFYSCLSLGAVNLNDNIERIEDFAFYQCGSLSSIKFPSKLKSIGRSAFYQCGFTELDFSVCPDLEYIERYAFFGTFELESIKFEADGDQTDGDQAVAPSKLREIGDYAFYESGVKQLNFPASLRTLGERCFYKNVSLTDVSFAGGIEKIGNYAFSGCTALESLTLSDTVKEIGTSAFYNCSSIKELDLKNVEKIGNYAFFGATGLSEIELPETIKSVGTFAFKGAGYNAETGVGQVNYVLLDDSIDLMQHSFYGLKTTTFYVTAGAVPKNWNARWNSSFRPVIYGCEVSTDENGKYVSSVSITEGSIENANSKNVVGAPEREGYVFRGWSTTQNGEVAYTADKITEAPVGTVLYAVWTVA